jgi:membrane protein required for colicin V production
MNVFDVALLVVVCLLVVVGMVKGIVRILVGLAALVAAFAVAATYQRPLADRLASWIAIPETGLLLVAYALLFLTVMLIGGLVAFLARKLVRAAMLSWADRVAGAALGFLTASLAAALVILPLVAYTPSGNRVLRQSVLAPYVAVVADLARPLVPEDLSRRYQEHIDDLRRFWRERFRESGPSSV